MDVRLAGDRAYTTSLRVPIILLALGLGIVGGAIQLMRTVARGPATQPTPSGPATAA
jgi:hypothetical protein